MKKALKKKAAASYTIIGGADGPTSVFFAGKLGEKSSMPLKYAIRAWWQGKKRKYIEKQITAGAHTIDETVQYMREKYRAAELPKTSKQYVIQKKECRAYLVQRYQPELLGELAELKKPDVEDKQSVMEFMELVRKQQEMAENISDEQFPMEYSVYRIKSRKLGKVYIEIEKKHGVFSVTSTEANRRKSRRLHQVVKDIYRYYGVTEKDIREKSERYQSLVMVLAEQI